MTRQTTTQLQAYMNSAESKQYIAIAQVMVEYYAPRILKQLKLHKKNDGILDRISYTNLIDDYRHGYFESRWMNNAFGQKVYLQPSGRVVLNPLTHLYRIEGGHIETLVEMGHTEPLLEMGRIETLLDMDDPETKVFFAGLVIFTVAHELRHYWQNYTGEKLNMESPLDYLTPYEKLPIEIDANQFANKFLMKKVKKRVIRKLLVGMDQ